MTEKPPVLSTQLAHLTANSTLADLPNHHFQVSPSTRGEVVATEFRSRPDLPGVIIADATNVYGILSREELLSQLSLQYGGELFLRRPIQVLINSIEYDTLQFTSTTSISDAAERALNRPAKHVYKPILVNLPNGSSSVVDIHVLLLAQTQLLSFSKRLKKQLSQSSKMEAIGQLAGGVAHDFNNLLTVIQANLSLALAELAPGCLVEQPLRDAEKAALRAANLTNQLLGFSRQKILRLEPTNLNQCVKETTALLRRIIDPRIVIDIDVDDDIHSIHADPDQIHQVLMNLCVNARDAMPNRGRLFLETANIDINEDESRINPEARPGHFVRLTITDNGAGIRPENLKHIFEPFYTTKGPGKGTGLGLAMCFGIVHQCGGWIECHSQLGEGTRFVLYFPASRKKSELTSIVDHTDEPEGGSETILLVDDEEMVRNVGRMVLQRYGYRVLTAEDGVDALEIYQRASTGIRLVILDITMPGLSGTETMQRLRKIDPNIPILFCSGYTTQELSDTEMEGVMGFVKKPYRPQELADAVRSALNQSELGESLLLATAH